MEIFHFKGVLSFLSIIAQSVKKSVIFFHYKPRYVGCEQKVRAT